MPIDASEIDSTDPVEAEIWKQAKAALKAGKEEHAIAMLRELANRGDWRASTSLGYIFESKGAKSPAFYAQAVHWYSEAVAKWDRPEPHLGLARYYYFGLGGHHDFQRVYEHLSVVPSEEYIEAALMMAELLFLGVGVKRDIARASQLFSLAAKHGYPLGLLGLGRVAKAQGDHWKSVLYSVRAFLASARLIWKNDNDVRLLGVGRRRGRLVLEKVVGNCTKNT